MPISDHIENIFPLPGTAENAEQITTLLRTAGVRVERIVSHGQCSPADFWYDQHEDEWVILLSGAASVAFDDGRPPQRLRAGDHVMIPAGQRHRVAWTDPDQDSVWLALFCQPSIRKEV